MEVYCLQCVTQKCRTVAQVLEYMGVHRAFAPTVLQSERKAGSLLEKPRDLLPGYVFVFMEEKVPDSFFFREPMGVMHPLAYSQKTWELHGSDLAFALELYARDGQIGTMKVLKCGDTVELLDPLFQKVCGRVSEMDIRKHRAKVTFEFGGKVWNVWISCDVTFQDEVPSGACLPE